MTDIEELALLRKIKQAKESGDLQGELIASRELSAARSAGTTAPAAPAPAPAPKSATGRIQEHGAEISRIMRGESPYGQSRGGRAVGVTAQALAAPWQYAVEPLSALVGAGAKAVRYAVPPDVRQTYKSGLGSLAGMIAPKVAPIAGQAMADWTIDPKTGRPRSPEEQAGLNRFAKDVATIATAGTPLGLVKPVAKVAGAVVREAGLGDVIRAAGQYVKKGGRKGIQETYKIPSPIAMQAGLTHPRGENKILDWMDEFRLEGRPNAVAKKAQSKIDKLEIDADKALEAQIAKTPDETVNSANVLGGLNEDLLTGKIEGTAMATPKELNGMSSRIAMMLRRKGLLGDIPLSKVP